MAIPDISHRQVRSFDGTTIAYQTRGEGPVVVLSNGLGGTFEAYRHVYALLGTRYRVLSWDYRGLYGSERPASLETLDLAVQARDLDCVLEHEGVDRAVFVGWSMGVQLNFEYYRRAPHRFAAIVAINGTSGRPFSTVFGYRFMSRVIPLALAVMKWRAREWGALTRYGAGWPGAVPMAQRLGLVAPTLDVDVWNDLAGGFAEMDFAYYAEMLRALGRHDASDVLPRITVPTLVLTGDRDVLTPLATAEHIARTVPDGRLVTIPGGTHYTPVEFPSVLLAAIRELLVEIAWGEPPRTTRFGAPASV